MFHCYVTPHNYRLNSQHGSFQKHIHLMTLYTKSKIVEFNGTSAIKFHLNFFNIWFWRFNDTQLYGDCSFVWIHKRSSMDMFCKLPCVYHIMTMRPNDTSTKNQALFTTPATRNMSTSCHDIQEFQMSMIH